MASGLQLVEKHLFTKASVCHRSSKVISVSVLSPEHMCIALIVNLLLCGMSSSLSLIGGSLLRMFIWCRGHRRLRIQWLGMVATRWLSRCYWRIMMFFSVMYV